jgi:hypothetical protein
MAQDSSCTNNYNNQIYKMVSTIFVSSHIAYYNQYKNLKSKYLFLQGFISLREFLSYLYKYGQYLILVFHLYFGT